MLSITEEKTLVMNKILWGQVLKVGDVVNYRRKNVGDEQNSLHHPL